ncbi:MAG: NAD(P)-dependent oxidoreductase [Opitutus sp.]
MNPSVPRPRVAFLGLGLMGVGMAQRLIDGGFPLTVYNRTASKAAGLANAGAQLATTPREAATSADVIVSMVADDNAARACWFGPTGALSAARSSALLIESSTVSVSWIHELDAAGRAQGCALLDAPVTGSKPQAASGELSFLVGGPVESFVRARPLFETMGRSSVHLGPTGSGALLKLINNFMCGVQTASLAEALALIEKGGLDRGTALNVLTNGAPGSPLVKALSARMTNADYTPNFLLRLMAKDLSYANAEGVQRGVQMSTAAAALNVFNRAIVAGLGEHDLSAVVESLRIR